MKFKFLLKKCFKHFAAISTIVVLSAFNSSHSQTGTIVTGTVVDSETQMSFPGVNIIEKGTSNGASTDFNGNYSITLTTNDAVLVVSYLGFKTQEIVVAGRSVIDVILVEDTEALNEVVVVGYGTVKKSDLTGSVGSIGAKSLTERNFTDPLESVQGNIAGVQISQSTGRLGDGFDIDIRGQSSFADSPPLFIVDGAPVNDIDFLNPQDIAQIDVLKDASSTAIYGSRGANGVVIVTTKSGSSARGGFNATYDSFIGFKEVTRLPELMDGPTWEYYHRSAYLAGFDDPLAVTPEQLQNTVANPNSNSILQRRFENNQTYDWYDAVLKSGIQQNNYLNLNGRSENGLSYNLGLGYQHETGNIENEQLDKYNIKVGVTHNVNDKFSFGANATLTHSVIERGSSNAMREAFRLNPFLSPFAIDDDGNETNELFDQPGKLTFPSTGQFAINKTSTYNPLLQIANSRDQLQRYNIIGNVFMQYNFTDKISFKTSLASVYDGRRRGRSWGVLTNEGRSNGNQPLGDLNKTVSINYTLDNQINYKNTFNESHNLNFLALQSIYRQNIESSFASSRNLPFESDFYNLGEGAQGTFNLGSQFLGETLTSYALRLNYDYQGKYFLTLSNRWDGYSLFSPDNKWDSFPSAAVAWKLSEEEFLLDSPISNLKLRASFGFTGNNAFNRNSTPYPTLNVLNNQTFYDFEGPVSGFSPAGLANSDLKWEKTKEWNIGLDFGLLNSKIRGSIDVYNRLSEDVISIQALPSELGVEGGILANASSVRNKGVEIVLGSRIIETDLISWDINLTYTKNTNSIESINGQTENDDIGNGWFIGESIGVAGENGNRSNFNYVFDGIWQAGQNAEAFGQTEGQARVRDINGDGVITPDDRVILGSVDPDWTGGIFSRLKVGNFDLSISAIISQGVFTQSPWLANFTDTRDRGRQKADIGWYVPENGAGIPAQFSNEYPQPRNQGTYWRNDRVGYYDDIDFIKIKNIAIGYNFNSKKLEKIKLKGLRIYANILNPFVFTDYMGYDPETASASLGIGRVSTVTYQFGASIKL